jgi:hypothetical protein
VAARVAVVGVGVGAVVAVVVAVVGGVEALVALNMIGGGRESAYGGRQKQEGVE